METTLNSTTESAALNDNINLSANDFDKQLLNFVKDFCTPYERMRESLGHVRVAATVEKATQGKDLPLWPVDTNYVSMDGILSLYNLMYGQANRTQGQAPVNEDDLLMEMIFNPSILCGCFAWEKVRNIVHVNNKQLDSSLLDCSCASLAKLPQWAICFNTVEQNLLWNERPVAGVIFYRYFLSKQPSAITGTPFNTNNGLDGEPDATINNLSTIVIYHNGEMDIGPYIELNAPGSINSYLDNMANRLQASSDVIEMSADHSNEELQKMAMDSTQRSREIFTLLAYLFKNLDQLKNAKGEKVSFAPNPEPVKTKNGYRLFGGDSSRSYYLDQPQAQSLTTLSGPTISLLPKIQAEGLVG